jgi:DNA polymerase-3 subunit epsilon
MREIVFDTETTGLSPRDGHRLVEIGCVELLNGYPTGRVFHQYLNPQRDMPVEAFNVHGLSAEFLRDKPLFSSVAAEFLAFIGEDATLVAHNANFDVGFLNAELSALGHPTIGYERVLDTLVLARRRNPGGRHDLDTLCSRYGIDNSRRTRHGALLDAEILAEVYVELQGGRQAGLALSHAASEDGQWRKAARRPRPLLPRLTAAELEAHRAFVAKMGPKAIWLAYDEAQPQA